MIKKPLIQCADICKIYQRDAIMVNALQNVNLSIDAGEFIAVLGASGSGKSTLMNILGCLDSPSTGTYWLEDTNVSHLSLNELATIRNKKIGFIFQSFNLLSHLNVMDNVGLPLVYRGTDAITRNQQAKKLLQRVGLAHRLTHFPTELSGGEMQRVAIARALVTDPKIILADEPTGNLDTKNSQEILQLFMELSSEGKTILVVTHNPDLARKLPRNIRIMDGKIVADESMIGLV